MRRGMVLLHATTAIFVSAVVLSFCVPLFLAAQRQAGAGVARARMLAMGRELAGRFRADVRQARQAEILAGGSGLRLATTRGTVLYRSAAGELTREAPGERSTYRRPFRGVRFRHQDRAVTASFELEERVNGRTLSLRLEPAAVPRSAQ